MPEPEQFQPTQRVTNTEGKRRKENTRQIRRRPLYCYSLLLDFIYFFASLGSSPSSSSSSFLGRGGRPNLFLSPSHQRRHTGPSFAHIPGDPLDRPAPPPNHRTWPLTWTPGIRVRSAQIALALKLHKQLVDAKLIFWTLSARHSLCKKLGSRI